MPPEVRDREVGSTKSHLLNVIYAELDAVLWEVLRERFGTLDPMQPMLLGLDGELEAVPAIVGNRLRVDRLRPLRPLADISGAAHGGAYRSTPEQHSAAPCQH